MHQMNIKPRASGKTKELIELFNFNDVASSNKMYMDCKTYDLIEKAEKSKGIRIVYKNIGDHHVEILYVGALEFGDLPDEYRYRDPCVYKKDSTLSVLDGADYSIVPGDVITKQKFGEIVNICRQAGDRLRRINKAKRDAEPKLLKI